jgi:hypothetical protein
VKPVRKIGRSIDTDIRRDHSGKPSFDHFGREDVTTDKKKNQ